MNTARARMTGNPAQQIFWFASQALGIVAILVLGISVSLGLAMSSRIIRRPGLPARLKHFHEASTLVMLVLIASHAGPDLSPSWMASQWLQAAGCRIWSASSTRRFTRSGRT